MTGPTLYAVNLFQEIQKLERRADTKREELGAFIAQLSPEETFNYITATER